MLLFRKTLPKSVGLHLLLCHPIIRKVKVVFSSPPLSVSKLKRQSWSRKKTN